MILLSRRSLLAIAAVVDIALHARPSPVAAKLLAARHALPPRHLETLLQTLVRVGILKGVRGPRGGYELARERRRITAGDIARAAMQEAIEDGLGPEPQSRLVDEVVGPEVAQASAAFLAALVGPMQVAGRIAEFVFAHRVNSARVGQIALFVFPVSLAILAFAGGSAWAVVAFAVLYGASNGVMTIVRGTVPAEIWGSEGYGGLTGLMATPVLLARAAGPLAAAGVLALAGGYVAVTLTLVVVGVFSWAAFVVAVRAPGA